MNTTVLATKWRPRLFSELIGQKPIVTALSNSLDSDRIHHSYLLTGSRGVGKTTLARILAKCLNCETNGISSKPCGKCATCLSIDSGQFVDLYEIDAASRTKVEDTRELLENVQYMPTQGRFKIYLIDEVHMLSTHSFNALLKTLEEPPEHVKFILATTDYQKIPSTILSRCLHFSLKKISPSIIDSHLQNILLKENIKFENKAIENISNLADGSMRDALSITEQCISHSEGNITYENVCKILCLMPSDSINKLCEMIVNEDINALMNYIDKLYYESIDFKFILEEIISILHQTAIYKATSTLKDLTYETSIQNFSKKYNEENIQTLYQICVSNLKDIEFAPNYRSGFEMAIIRILLFTPFDFKNIKKESNTDIKKSIEKKNNINISNYEDKNKNKKITKAKENPIDFSENWETVVSRLEIDSITRNLAKNIVFETSKDNKITFLINSDVLTVATDKSQKKLEEALSIFYGETIYIKIVPSEQNLSTIHKINEDKNNDKIQAAEILIDNDDFVKTIKEKYSATSINNSVKIIENSEGD